MAYNQYGQWVDDSGYSPTPGAGMPSVSTGGAVLGPGGWSDQSPYRQVNDPRTAYQPLYGNHNHMDDEAALGGLLDQSGYGRNTPQRSQTLQLLQGLQQQRQPLQQMTQPGIYDFDPTRPFNAPANYAAQAVRGGRGAIGGAIDNVFTGHGSEKLPENSSVTSTVQQLSRMLSGQPGFMQVGNTVQVDGFQPRQIPEGADASYAARMAAANARAPLTDDERVSKLTGYLRDQQAKGTMDAEKANQIFTHVMGVDPQAYAATKQKNMEIAAKLQNDALETQQKQAALQKDQFANTKMAHDFYDEIGKKAVGIPSEIIHQTAGWYWIDPKTGEGVAEGTPGAKHIYGAFDPGTPADPTTGETKHPSRIVGIDPTLAQYINRQRQAVFGQSNVPQNDTTAALAKIARGHELIAKDAASSSPSASPSLSSWMQNPDNAAQASNAPWTNALTTGLMAPINNGIQSFDYALNNAAVPAYNYVQNRGGFMPSAQGIASNSVGAIQGSIGALGQFFGTGQSGQPSTAPPPAVAEPPTQLTDAQRRLFQYQQMRNLGLWLRPELSGAMGNFQGGQ